MKHVRITYHMEDYDDHDSAETCITLPMLDRLADELLADQENSRLLYSDGTVAEILMDLAYLQGYSDAEFVCAEPVAKPVSRHRWIDSISEDDY